jgi:hypothetical protein
LASGGQWPTGHGSNRRGGDRDGGGTTLVVRTDNEEVWKH